MLAQALLVLRDFHRCGADLAGLGSVELVVQDLVVVDQGWSLSIKTDKLMVVHSCRLARRRVEECPAELLTVHPSTLGLLLFPAL